MFRVSKKMMIAVETVLDIDELSQKNPAGAKDLAERRGTPARYLEQVLQELVHANILRGVRGPQGGYILDRPLEEIRVSDVINVVRNIEQSEKHACAPHSDRGMEKISPFVRRIERQLVEQMQGVTLLDLRPT